MRQQIPQTNPHASFTAHEREIRDAISRTLESGWFILGRETDAFEKGFARFLGAAGSVGVGNGTDALVVAMKACGVERGDGVITVSHTAVATVAAIEMAGAIPILADIDPITFTLSPAALKRTIEAYQAQTSHNLCPLKAIVVVHLYGHPADLVGLLSIADHYGLALIEDCAQCHGAQAMGRSTGTWGKAAAFSFYPTKNLGALGDGGAVVSQDPLVLEKARLIREYGWKERYISAIPGMNTRLDEIQSAILTVKLAHLDEENRRRQAIAEQYTHQLSDLPLQLPSVSPRVSHVFHQYVIRSERRGEIQSFARDNGIGTLIHYPVPVHLQPAYAGRLLIDPNGLPETEAAAATVLSLPMHAHLTDDEVRRSAMVIRDFFKK
jgi:dTDP-4-amino-4,6-dideoxygalactose transaminase